MISGIYLLLAIIVSVIYIILATSAGKMHPFMALLSAALGLGLVAGMPFSGITSAISSGFGGLLGYIGIVVILGSIIGVALERSGAALQIARYVLKAAGPRRPGFAMSLIGAIVSIPVFCDSAFILLSSLNDAVAEKSKASKATLSLALGTGLYTTHTLVPPTPGPIAAAGNLGASEYLGLIMIVGLVVSIPALGISLWLSNRLGKNIVAEALVDVEVEPQKLPGIAQSLIPILLPIVLIALASILRILKIEGGVATWLLFTGEPLIALLLGVAAAFLLLRRYEASHVNDWIKEGIRLAGPILIITGAGGAFGGVLKATPIEAMVSGWVQHSQLSGSLFLLAAFGIAALLKSSQGSSTNALVITSSLFAPLVAVVGMESPFELALTVAAIGAGAMVVSHANDSYFWVFNQFSRVSVKDTYRSFTIITGAQGVAAIMAVLLLFFLFG